MSDGNSEIVFDFAESDSSSFSDEDNTQDSELSLNDGDELTTKPEEQPEWSNNPLLREFGPATQFIEKLDYENDAKVGFADMFTTGGVPWDKPHIWCEPPRIVPYTPFMVGTDAVYLAFPELHNSSFAIADVPQRMCPYSGTRLVILRRFTRAALFSVHVVSREDALSRGLESPFPEHSKFSIVTMMSGCMWRASTTPLMKSVGLNYSDALQDSVRSMTKTSMGDTLSSEELLEILIKEARAWSNYKW
jgi:hypothetical protein